MGYDFQLIEMVSAFKRDNPTQKVLLKAYTEQKEDGLTHVLVMILGEYVGKEWSIESEWGWGYRDFEEQCFRILKGKFLWDTYYSKGLKSPQQRFTEKWLDNIINDKADSRGEYIPEEGTY